jgi:hypothetical protein
MIQTVTALLEIASRQVRRINLIKRDSALPEVIEGESSGHTRVGNLDLRGSDAGVVRLREYDAARAVLRDPAAGEERDGSAGAVMAREEIAGEVKEVAPSSWEVNAERPERSGSSHPALAPRRNASVDGQQGQGVSGMSRGVRGSSRRHRDASVLEQRTMHLAVISLVMRVQGFSEPSIFLAQQRAARMYDVFQAQGIRVPTPKVFDPTAPSARTHPGRRSSPDRTVNREIERGPSEPSVLSR